MGEVVSFRPSEEEESILQQAQKSLGADTRAQALRFLIREGAKAIRPMNEDPVWKFRLPTKYRPGRSLSSREIDDFLYSRKNL